MAGKRLQLARLLMAMGVPRLIARNMPAALFVLNYHRIHAPGGGQSTNFDDGVFDTDLETFRRQMQWLRSATDVLDENSLLKAGSRNELPRGTICSAVTFDDGYVDCHTLVKPVLDELGIRGIFFIPVEMLESRRLGWWDLAAYVLKRTKCRSIRVDGQTYDLAKDFPQSLRRILNLFKLEKADRTAGLLGALSEACAVALPTKDEQSAELMSWDQVRDLRSTGHAIGSHSLSHRVLATLDPHDQAREILDSRRELQAMIGCSINSFAYPVGGPQHINHHSVALVREAGYDQAFTYNTGIASVPVADRFQIPRESAKTLAILKGKVLLPWVMGIQTGQRSGGQTK
jgi:peptidoglycan/xylan/chitin deacetylase (PgdA/CDA1 family)